MSTEEDGEQKLLVDFCQTKQKKITFAKMIDTPCYSMMFQHLHHFSQLLMNYSLVDKLPTLDQILEDITKTELDGVVTEKEFFEEEDISTPDKKATVIEENASILMIKEYDPNLILYHHYHLYHLISHYLHISATKINSLSAHVREIRKRCWYFLCAYTSEHNWKPEYQDNGYKSNLSVFAQYHNWYIDQGTDEYNLQMSKFVEQGVLDPTTPLDSDTGYWFDIYNNTHFVLNMINDFHKGVSNDVDTPDPPNDLPPVVTLPVSYSKPCKIVDGVDDSDNFPVASKASSNVVENVGNIGYYIRRSLTVSYDSLVKTSKLLH